MYSYRSIIQTNLHNICSCHLIYDRCSIWQVNQWQCVDRRPPCQIATTAYIWKKHLRVWNCLKISTSRINVNQSDHMISKLHLRKPLTERWCHHGVYTDTLTTTRTHRPLTVHRSPNASTNVSDRSGTFRDREIVITNSIFLIHI